jgi:hypothetical protein
MAKVIPLHNKYYYQCLHDVMQEMCVPAAIDYAGQIVLFSEVCVALENYKAAEGVCLE